MKTTIDLPESLIRQARELANREHTTLKALVETGLRGVIAERSRDQRFELVDAGIDGRGIQPAFRDAGWGQIREAVYGRSE